jgi:ABC-type antimicrobial peptide transport system permease subunit
MGIRMALGAKGGQLVKLILRKGVVQIVIGLGIGLLLAVLTANPLQIILYEVNARDPIVFSLVIAVLALTGMAASLVPAFRITKLDLISALTPE